MRGQGVNLGAAVLAGLRRSMGATQEDLAERAGMSVRAIRYLESGRTQQPRNATLRALAAGLGLQSDEAEAFLKSWSAPRQLLTFSDLNLPGDDIETLLALEENIATGFRDLVIFEEFTIGQDRRLQSNANVVCMTALEGEVERRLLLWLYRPDLEPERVELTALSGCHVVASTVVRRRGITAFEMEFDRPVPAGESRVFSFRVDLDWSGLPEDSADFATSATHGFRRRTDLYGQRVSFPDGTAPREAWQVARTPDGDPERDPVPVCGQVLEIVRHALEPGTYGFEWTWEPGVPARTNTRGPADTA